MKHEKKQRPGLTQEEYQMAKGLVMKRLETLAEISINSNDKFPWEDPNLDPRTGIQVKIEDQSLQTTKYLIEFLTDAKSNYSDLPMTFLNYYVHVWNELKLRVEIFERPVIEAVREAKEQAQRAEERIELAEERAERTEKRQQIHLRIAVIALLISAIALALSIIK